MIVCSVRKNDCHSERSEEPPHFRFCTCSCSCICIHPLPPGIVISTRGGALCRRSGETPAFCSCRCSCFCSCPLFPSTHPKNRHFDRSGSQSYRGSRSGEICCLLPCRRHDPQPQLFVCRPTADTN